MMVVDKTRAEQVGAAQARLCGAQRYEGNHMKFRYRLGRLLWGQGFMDIPAERGAFRIVARAALGWTVYVYAVISVTGIIFSHRFPWSWQADGLFPIWAQLLVPPVFCFVFALALAGVLWREKVRNFKASGAGTRV